jgi:DNA-binding MarR family transcriptional regulator
MNDHDDIVIALRKIARATEVQSKHLYREVGLTTPQVLVLQAIQAEGSLPTSSVARRICVSQATVTRIIDRLVSAGLVERRKSETDRRVIKVSLTELGEEKLAQAPELLQPEFRRAFESLEPWEQQMLTSALVRISRLMDLDSVHIAPIVGLEAAAEEMSAD